MTLFVAATAMIRLEVIYLKSRAIANAQQDRMQSFPSIMLWAWERPEDLTFIDTKRVGVAFLAKTLILRNSQVIVLPRLQPLKAAVGVKLMAVARIEADRSESLLLIPSQEKEAASQIAKLSEIPGVGGIQIDFDALQSQRTFYARLIRAVRRQMPAGLPLSITALASWCLWDDWIKGLPIDEAVPMLFRMGPEGPTIMVHLLSGQDFDADICRASIGISTDERIAPIFKGRCVYAFSPSAWTQPLTQEVSRRLENP